MSTQQARELALACTCHVVSRLLLRFALPGLLRFSNLELPMARRPLSPADVHRLAALSRRVCRGTCLTESVVLKMLSRRHGNMDCRLSIGVRRDGNTFQAHAWTGNDTPPGGYVPLWSEPRQVEPDPGLR